VKSQQTAASMKNESLSLLERRSSSNCGIWKEIFKVDMTHQRRFSQQSVIKQAK
jgi:hypothetical protein